MRFQISTPDDGKSAVDQQTRQVWGDKVRRDGEAQRYMGREGAHETRVRAQSSSTPLCQRRNVVMTWWYGNPNRPRSLSARASLHARARPKVVREAPKRPALRAQLRAPLLRHRRWRRRHVAEAISEHGGGFQLSNLRSARGSTTTS